MSSRPQSPSTIIQCLRYRDAPAAIDWLCSVFGLSQRLVVPGEAGKIAHAELAFGGGMLMLGSIHDNEYGRQLVQPDEIDDRVTASVYLVVPDADAVYAKVQAAGGKIVMEIHDEDYGGRGFACRDLEGHLWYVGTYDPFAAS